MASHQCGREHSNESSSLYINRTTVLPHHSPPKMQQTATCNTATLRHSAAVMVSDSVDWYETVKLDLP